MFELKDRDAGGRIGTLSIGKKNLETPAMFTVVNPNKLTIPPKELEKSFGLDLLITNSYIIWKNPELRQKAVKSGLHDLLDFNGLIMTDSGAFQLQAYGEVEVDNEGIIKFQEEIGSDVGVILDIPKCGTHDEVKSALKTTLNRVKEWSALRDSHEGVAGMGWAGPIQGATHPDLVKESANFMKNYPFDYYALGSCVPLLEAYDFASVIRNILTCKSILPKNKPLHTFGAGLPQFFSLAVAAGSDLFDSAAYVLYAENDRYITLEGTKRLKKLDYLTCSCPVCSKYSADQLKKMGKKKRTNLLSRHNLWVMVSEIKTIKQAIREGRLFELAEQRCRAHPKLLEGLHALYDRAELLEKFDPVTKRSAFLYTGRESVKRPAVIRYQNRLMKRFLPANKTVSLSQSPIGLVPKELEGMYPVGQCVHISEGFNWSKKEFLKKYGLNEGRVEVSLRDKLRARARFQFGEGGEAVVDDVQIEVSKKTGRVRRLRRDNEVIATVRPRDGFLVLNDSGARIIHQNIQGYRVIMKDSDDFVREGRSAMNKFVVDADPEIRPKDEVLVVNEDDELLGSGQALLNREEMLDFNRGAAVKVRTKLSSG